MTISKHAKKAVSFILIIIFVATVAYIGYGSQHQPASEGDPIVTKSYVDQKIQQLKYYVDEKLQSIVIEKEVQAGNIFVVVELKQGERLIAGQGTELILRGGKAVAIDSPQGGLSNVTGATDIRKDQAIPANNLLIVPRNDGRGVRAITDVILMVRGSYTIQQ